MTNAQIIPAILIPLIAWRFYRRIRSNIGVQKFNPRRSAAVLVIIGFISVILALSPNFQIDMFSAEAGGLAVGALLGFVGLKLTRFEFNERGRFYVPNAYLGVGVSLLFIGRIVYRFLALYSHGQNIQSSAPGLGQSPLTYLLFGITAGYYISYHLGLLLEFRRANGVVEKKI